MGRAFKEVSLISVVAILYSLSSASRLLGEVKKVEALLGGRAALPCDVTLKDNNDSLLLLVWYKSGKPFYSYDGRLQKHWRNKEFPDSSRVLFTFHREPAALLMDRVTEQDHGTYRCRADFSHSPTRNSGILLAVIILPSKPFFMDELGNKVETSVGPLHEGDTLLLVCLCVGGSPPPRVQWWWENTLVDSTDEDSEVPGIRENQLLLPLSREYTNTLLHCLASNNNVTAPLSSELRIQLYVSPLTVSILSSNQALSAGRQYELPCYINGSHPLPEVSWWLDGKILTDQQIVTEVMGSEIISTLHFTPQAEHNGMDLTCLATNSVLAPTHASKLHTLRLNIFFEPVVSLSLVTNKHGNSTTQEGEVVQLRCMVEANPWISNTEWFANNETIHGSVFNESDISLTSSDLIILNASTWHSGRYRCKAFNIEGQGESNFIDLQVLYKPRCFQNTVLINHRINSLTCPIVSLPIATKYYWRIENQTAKYLNENIIISDKNNMNLESVQKTLEENYIREVVISCWSSNEAGEQKVPCIIYLQHHFIAPSKPENCSVYASSNALVVKCSSGTEITSDLMFGLSAWQLVNNSRKSINNITTPLPNMKIGSLEEEQMYEMLVYTFNRWGQSEPVQLLANTTSTTSFFDNAQADIGLWCGVGAGIVLTIVSLVVILIIKKKTKTVIMEGARCNKNNIPNGKTHLTSNMDTTDKPLLYTNGPYAKGIILTRNNSEPKIMEDLKPVQNIDENNLPPSVCRNNKPKITPFHIDTGSPPVTKRSFKTSKHRKEIERANGSIQMVDKNIDNNLSAALQIYSMSKESIV